jgi:hypothetical protein
MVCGIQRLALQAWRLEFLELPLLIVRVGFQEESLQREAYCGEVIV